MKSKNPGALTWYSLRFLGHLVSHIANATYTSQAEIFPDQKIMELGQTDMLERNFSKLLYQVQKCTLQRSQMDFSGTNCQSELHAFCKICKNIVQRDHVFQK